MDIALMVGTAAVCGEVWLYRRQTRQQHFEVVTQLARDWHQLAPDLKRLRAVCAGPGSPGLGLDRTLMGELRDAVASARAARIALSDALRSCDAGDSSALQDADESDRVADAALLPFRESVDRVALFLARLFTDVCGGHVSLNDAYRIAGQDIAPLSSAMRTHLTVPVDVVSGCPGPFHLETEAWRNGDLHDVAERVLWTEQLVARPAQHRKVFAMVDLLEAEAVLVGDVEHVAPELDEPRLIAAPTSIGRIRSLTDSRLRGRRLARRLVDATVRDHRSLDVVLPTSLGSRWARVKALGVRSVGDYDDGRYRSAETQRTAALN